MAALFKPTRPYPLPADAEIVTRDGKPHVRLREQNRTAFYPLTANGKQYLKPAPKWAAEVTFADGTRKRVRFSPNRSASAVMLADLLKRIENERAGIHDPFHSHARKPLTKHLEDWLGSLKANGRGEDYIGLKASRVRAFLDSCSWVFADDMTADSAEQFLADLRNRRPELPAIPPGKDWFTMTEAARLMGGVTRQTVAVLVKRNSLEAVGNGRARRYPRRTLETLQSLKDRGCSPQTANHYLDALRQFARWLVDNGRVPRSPFARLKPMNTRTDQRRRRGELSPEELHSLFKTTEVSSTTFRGLSGQDRVMLYRVAVGTGFRAAELSAVRPTFFDLTSTPPVVILPAEFTKNRRTATQPIAKELADSLRVYLEGRSEDSPVWSGNWFKKAADMLRADFQAGGIPVEVDGPEGTETRDFHALRAVFISNVIRSGADLKQAMTLARHSDPRLTTARYARTRIHDLGEVIIGYHPFSSGAAREQHREQQISTTNGDRQGRSVNNRPFVPNQHTCRNHWFYKGLRTI